MQNVDAGTMNPYEHGEVFVTADGWIIYNYLIVEKLILT